MIEHQTGHIFSAVHISHANHSVVTAFLGGLADQLTEAKAAEAIFVGLNGGLDPFDQGGSAPKPTYAAKIEALL